MYLNLPKLGLADLDSILVTSLLNEMTACTFSTSWRPVIIKLYCLNAASRYLDGKQKHTTSGTSCLMAILWAYSKAQLSVNEKQIQSSKIPWLPQKINSESTKNAHQRTLEYISDHRSSLLTGCHTISQECWFAMWMTNTRENKEIIKYFSTWSPEKVRLYYQRMVCKSTFSLWSTSLPGAICIAFWENRFNIPRVHTWK